MDYNWGVDSRGMIEKLIPRSMINIRNTEMKTYVRRLLKLKGKVIQKLIIIP